MECFSMKKVLLSLLTAIVVAFLTSVSVNALETEYYDIKSAGTSSYVKPCACKKHFENHLGLTREQIKKADANRKVENNELKPINSEIKSYYKQIKEINNSELADPEKTEKVNVLKKNIADLKTQKTAVKAKYNSNFESYLTKEQLKTLEYMRKMKKEGKSCCPCGKNRYY